MIFRNSLIAFVLMCLLGCSVGIPSSQKLFPAKMYFDDDEPNRPFEPIDYVYLNDERPNNANKHIKEELIDEYGQLPKGYTYDEKQYLLYQLSKKAKEKGADAVIQVRYQLYIKKDVYGYNLKGLAVRYSTPVEP